MNLRTASGLTMLHLAVWNGHAASVAVLLGRWLHRPNPWRKRVLLHVKLAGRPHTELDVAVMRRHVDCARLLVRAGCTTRALAGAECSELLHRLILLGDGIAAELMLRQESNKVVVNRVLLNLTKALKYPDTCTFTFAGYSNPMPQHMYECTICNQTVCLVCRDKVRCCFGVCVLTISQQHATSSSSDTPMDTCSCTRSATTTRLGHSQCRMSMNCVM